jgi:hypothetical protein
MAVEDGRLGNVSVRSWATTTKYGIRSGMAKKQRATPHASPPSLQPPAGAENAPKPAGTASNNWRVDQADVPAKILDFYLAEYNQSRNEMTVYNNRIDRIILTYVSAIFAIFGYFLAVKDTPGSDLTSKMRSLLDLIQTNASMKSVLLVITILQAFLVLLVTA